MLRIVVDTNVLVSGTLVAEGPSARILHAARNQKIVLVISRRLLAEYADVIHRPHIIKRYARVEENAETLVNFLSANAELADDLNLSGFVQADPKDDIVIACALAGNADYIVSGDPHLNQLTQVRGIPITKPSEFVATLK